MKIKKNKLLRNILIISSILILLVIASYFSFVKQSVLVPPTTVSFANGKVYWIAANIANSMDESWTFNYKVGDNVNNYALNDGTGRIVKPQKSMSITFSKGESYCYYTLTKTSISYTVLGIPKKFDYWIFNNAQRVANVNIKDSSGNSLTVNGAQTLDHTFYDRTDGKGSVTIQSQGLLVSDSDCPPQENVAIYVDKAGYAKITYKNQLEDAVNKYGGVYLNEIDKNTQDNTQFLNGFTNYDMSPLDGYFKGYKNLGNSVLTFTADQDYFDSIIYTPPKIVTPSIYQLICPDSVATGASESIMVKIKNLDTGSGYVNIIPIGTNAVVTPLSRNMLLSDTISAPFTITAKALAGTGRVDVQVCSQSQFGGSKCDSSSCSFKIIENNPAVCGDGICQISETNTTCPADCGGSVVAVCGNGKIEYGEQCDDGNIINGDGCSSTCQIEKNTCGYWIRFPKFLGGKGIPNLFCLINNWFMKFRLVFSIILGFFSGLFAFLFSKDNIVNKKDKKEKWISPSIGVVLGVAIGFLAFTYFWLALISLLILVIIKKIIPKLK